MVKKDAIWSVNATLCMKGFHEGRKQSKDRTCQQLRDFTWVDGKVFVEAVLVESKGCEKFPQRRKRKKRISNESVYAELEVR